MMNETKKNIETLEMEAMEQVTGGCSVVGGKLIPSQGCRCGSAAEDMNLNSVTFDPDRGSTRFRFLCGKCGRPLNSYSGGDHTAEYSGFIIP